MRHTTTALLLLLLCALGVRAGEPEFRADVEALTAGPHRLSGSPEIQAAGDHVLQRLRAMGVTQIHEQRFPMPVLVQRRCELVAGGQTLPLQPMRPNEILPPATPEAGITGRLVDVGDGDLRRYPADFAAGDIAVMDYNSYAAWRDAFRLGAAAVIFVQQADMNSRHEHSTTAPANFPRYYYEGSRDTLPLGQSATIHCEATWQSGTGRNIIAIIPGTDPDMDKDVEAEAFVLAAPLDSFGEAPWRSPGARQAANVAALLQAAEIFQANPPRRHTVLAFLDGDAWGHVGAAAFYRLTDDQDKLKQSGLAKRIAANKAEQRFIAALLTRFDLPYPPRDADAGAADEEETAAADPDAPVDENEPVSSRTTMSYMRDGLMNLAAARSYALDQHLKPLRLARGRTDDVSPEEATLVQEKRYWTLIRKHLNGRDDSHDTWPTDEELASRLKEILQDFHAQVLTREQELTDIAARLEVESAIHAALGTVRIALHVSYMLGDRTDRWGLVVGDRSRQQSPFDEPGLYTRVQSRFLAALEQAEGTEVGRLHAERSSMDLTASRQDTILATSTYSHSGAVAGLISVFNVAVGTVQDDQGRLGTPADTVAALDVAGMARQAAHVTEVLRVLSDDAAMTRPKSIRYAAHYIAPEFKSRELMGVPVLSVPRGSSRASQRTAGAVVVIHGAPVSPLPEERIPGFNNVVLMGTDMSGTVQIGPATQPIWDNYDGFAATFDERGMVSKAMSGETLRGFNRRVVLYDVKHGALMLPAAMDTSLLPKVLEGPSNGPLQVKKNYASTRDGVTFWFVEEKMKTLKFFATGPQTTLALLGTEAEDTVTEGTTDDGTGSGLSVLGMVELDVTQQAAEDVWRLNEERLSVLRRKGIMNGSMEELHGRAEDLRISAHDAADIAGAQADYAASLALQQRTYGPVRGMLDDLVKAVLILLALCVPFAFSLERLLIGAVNIYKQIGWFVLFFVATFLLLYVSHPAFAISKTPTIIFLGFTIVVLSVMVIVIIMQKFETELKILQGMESTVHAADVSRMSTVLAAMSMGISSMRRRPLRTALTAITIILLTFTILGFASFGSQQSVLTYYVQPSLEYAGVYVHQISWQPIPETMVATARNKWSQDAPMVTRRWISPDEMSATRVVVSAADGEHHTALTALLGLDEAELKHRPELARMLVSTAPFDESVWLTQASAERLGVSAGDQVIVNGRLLTLGTPLSAVEMIGRADLDESALLPVDFRQAQSTKNTVVDMEQMAMGGNQSWQSVPPDATVVVANSVARDLGADTRAIVFYPATVTAASALAEDIARILPMPVAGSRSDGVYRHILGSALAASGLKSLIFPILLGGLVIFGTMLGSVADREKEIYTFSALGLAPPHVAGLFFAEALIYSVIGGLGGYLLAQGSMKVLELIATTGLIRVPEMNYSSTNAIVTILLVMATVMISAVYPAIKASRSANPGVMRGWRIPEPNGDTLEIDFPFTVSVYDITGVVSFLKEHFDTFSDVGLGDFMTMNSQLIKTENGNLGIEADLALAPFDLGVTQTFRLTSAPSEIEGIDMVAITIIRRSGQPKDWKRQNKLLLDDLRKQFLLWRALPTDTMEMYRSRTMARFGDASPGTPPAGSSTDAPATT